MKTLVTLAAGIAVLCAPCSAQGLKQTPESNIVVAACNPHQHPAGSLAHPWIDPYGNVHGTVGFPYTEGFLEISYTNTAEVAAQEIDFALVSRGWLIALAKDAGTFAPGVHIEHEFSLDPEVFPVPPSPYCEVLRVRYTNGTEWNNPNPPQQ